VPLDALLTLLGLMAGGVAALAGLGHVLFRRPTTREPTGWRIDQPRTVVEVVELSELTVTPDQETSGYSR
jgi:hypothetical protein